MHIISTYIAMHDYTVEANLYLLFLLNATRWKDVMILDGQTKYWNFG